MRDTSGDATFLSRIARLPSAQDRIDDLLGALARHLLAAFRAVRFGDGPVQDAQVVVDLGHGRDNRTRVPARRVLLDGNRRRESLDLLDLGLREPVEKLTGVGRERLDVSALSLRIERVERKRRLAAPGQPRDDRKRIAGNRHVDSLEVVHPRLGYDDVRHGK